MITISAFKWVPEIARGQVRDLRARWALEEAGLRYRTRLLEQGDQDKPDYRALQPFGQVPVLEDNGLVLFESGAVVHARCADRRLRAQLDAAHDVSHSFLLEAHSHVDAGRRAALRA